MNLSKSFGCISHNLLILKLEAYSSSEDVLILMQSYLRWRKQSISHACIIEKDR